MEIRSEFQHGGRTFLTHYVEEDPSFNLPDGVVIRGVHAICFYDNKMVVVYANSKQSWTPPGGGIEPGETYQEAAVREVQEEANMKVLQQKWIGYQDVSDDGGKLVRQVRVLCIVEPLGDFISDPDGDITEIKLIDPKDFKQYVDWGDIGERIMKRALEIKAEHD